jgi:hypothetical protein
MAPELLPLRPWFLAIALTCAACSDSPPDAAPHLEQQATAHVEQQAIANTENACELLTEEDAEAALGSPIEDETDESSLRPMGEKVLSGRCYYEGDGGSVSLSVQKHVDAAYAGERFALYRKRSNNDPSFRFLDGLGDEAFAERERLHVKRGDLVLVIELKYSGERQLKHYSDKPGLEALAADERKIAQQALQRLPPVAKS